MRVLVLSSWSPSLLSFRGHLLSAMAAAGHEVLACGPNGTSELRAELGKRGIAYRDVPLVRNRLDPVSDLRTAASLIRLFRSFRPEVSLSYTVKPVVYGSVAAWMSGVPRIYALVTGLGYSFIDQGSLSHRLLSRAVRRLYRAGLSRTSAVFFQNRDDEALFRELGLVGGLQPSHVLSGSGVDLVHFAPAPPVSEPLVFLLIARLIKGKGLQEFVDAARIVRRVSPHARFLILGPKEAGPSAVPPRDLETWRQEGVIEYLGEVKDVRPYIAKASVYVLPSYREGMPRSVLEAMAMGRPIVTTDVPGCRETVEEGRNGFMVPVRSADSLASAMLKFVDDPGLVEAMGKESRRLAEERYDVRDVTARMLAVMGLDSSGTSVRPQQR